jgi:hypothetical protein
MLADFDPEPLFELLVVCVVGILAGIVVLFFLIGAGILWRAKRRGVTKALLVAAGVLFGLAALIAVEGFNIAKSFGLL